MRNSITIQRIPDLGAESLHAVGLHFQGFEKQNEGWAIFGFVNRRVTNLGFSALDK
jgi:hypothetical protein